MEYNSEEELLEVVNGFLGRTLEKQRWTHHAHIITTDLRDIKTEL